MIRGVYGIHNTSTDRWYVGQSRDVIGRYKKHLSLLKAGRHPNTHLQASYSKYSGDKFAFVVLEEVAFADLLTERENFWMLAKGKNSKGLYNFRVAVDSTLGFYHSPETLAKLSAAAKGRSPSLATRAKLSAALKGRKHTPEARARMALAQTGRTISPEVRAKLSIANKGRKLSPERCAQRSKAQQGRKASFEARINMSVAQKGLGRCFSASEASHVRCLRGRGFTFKAIAVSMKCSVATIGDVVNKKRAYATIEQRLFSP